MATTLLVREEIRIVQGDSLVIRITVLDDDGNTANLTSGTVHFRVKLRVGAPTVEIAKSSAVPTEIEILPQGTGVDTNGQADIFIDPGDTAGLKKGAHVYDVWVEDIPSPGDNNVVIAPSPFIIEPAVTILTAPAPPPVPGSNAPQTQQERSFLHTWTATGDTDTVTIPGSGMIDDTYSVMAFINTIPLGGAAAILISPQASRTAAAFDLEASGSLLIGTTIDIILRDRP